MRKQRILIIRIDFLGDMICTTPLIHAIKKKFPNSEIHVLANKYNAPVLDRNPDVAFVHTYVYSKNRERNVNPGIFSSLINRLALIFKLRRIHFDLGIIPNGGLNKNSIQFIRQLNIPDCRWHTKESEFDDRNADHVANRPIKHEVLSGFDLMPEIETPEVNTLKLYVYPDPLLRDEWMRKMGSANKPKIGLFISNKSKDRQLDIDKWADLVRLIGSEAEFFIFHDQSEAISKQYFSGLPVHYLNTTSVQDMIAATSCMSMIVSADSAPVHLCSALQIPVVSLFENRPEKYLRWHPLNVENILLKEGKVVNDIDVIKIRDAVNFLLKKCYDQSNNRMLA
ncbi:glycosyltransferase family 9 protein [Xenorhabdus sp. 12]|uniref:Glycosyltransferase family 9 protein n=1 Tax=Xenorhabdus santafensis TaxID=2582833 RepID=A0ABU4SD56_9GAMM|nr:glycosyltransferase family 9 protein [Xenorhabdus sp. 12]MDX7988704.1 glycosyltransferase family 9 protein [Xenorhabdus sp. 12]